MKQTKVTPQDVARTLARRLVRQQHLVALSAPQCILDKEDELVARAWAEAEEVGLEEVGKLLPQEYDRSEMERLVKDRLDETSIGALYHNVCAELGFQEGKIGEGSDWDNPSWRNLRDNLPKDKEEAVSCLGALAWLLGQSRSEIVDLFVEGLLGLRAPDE